MVLKPRNVIDEDDPRVAQIGHPAPAWLVNYADLMTEMVCFFIILYALSVALSKQVQAAKKQVEEVIKKESIQGEVKITKEGMSITLQEQGSRVFFDSGKADLKPEMADVLGKIAPVLRDLSGKHEIVVEGHTDNIPLRAGSPFESNWELSTGRATNVLRFLVRKEGLKPQHISAVGYGEYRPVAPNDTPEDRSKNRRVVFFVKNAPAQGGKMKEEETPPPPYEKNP